MYPIKNRKGKLQLLQCAGAWTEKLEHQKWQADDTNNKSKQE